MVTIVLPGERGVRAKKALLKYALKLKNKYDIHFDRNAHDEYEAIYGILRGMEELVQELQNELRNVDKTRALINAVIAEKGEITAEGVYVWPKHLKEEAEEMGIDWESFKEQLKKTGLLEFDPQRKKYKVNV